MDLTMMRRIAAIVGTVAAFWLGWKLAVGEFLFPAAAATAILLLVLSRQTGMYPDVLVGGLVILGYLVGNRGFAQLHPPNFPLLPAEAALALGAACVIWRATQRRELPFHWRAVDVLVAAWILIGLSRLWFDFRTYGFLAVRDFAMVYYAVFYFIAVEWAADPKGRRWIERCLTVGLVLSAPLLFAFILWPDIVTAPTVMGIPLIFIKSDVAGSLIAAGVFWTLHRYSQTRHWHWLLFTAIGVTGVFLSNSRAAMVALVLASLWLPACRLWARVRPLAGLAGLGVLALVIASLTDGRPWNQSTAYRLYESALSVTDPEGTRVYRSETLADKPDNNEFRMVWWQSVVHETLTSSPWLGLGFGYDLADQFTREYYADVVDEFTTRSPHNFLLSVIGRMGILGSFAMLGLLGSIGLATWRTGRLTARGESDGYAFTALLGVWAILFSACFGVVLEGPMGAVIFWTLLGLSQSDATDGNPPAEAAGTISA